MINGPPLFPGLSVAPDCRYGIPLSNRIEEKSPLEIVGPPCMPFRLEYGYPMAMTTSPALRTAVCPSLAAGRERSSNETRAISSEADRYTTRPRKLGPVSLRIVIAVLVPTTCLLVATSPGFTTNPVPVPSAADTNTTEGSIRSTACGSVRAGSGVTVGEGTGGSAVGDATATPLTGPDPFAALGYAVGGKDPGPAEPRELTPSATNKPKPPIPTPNPATKDRRPRFGLLDDLISRATYDVSTGIKLEPQENGLAQTAHRKSPTELCEPQRGHDFMLE